MKMFKKFFESITIFSLVLLVFFALCVRQAHADGSAGASILFNTTACPTAQSAAGAVACDAAAYYASNCTGAYTPGGTPTYSATGGNISLPCTYIANGTITYATHTLFTVAQTCPSHSSGLVAYGQCTCDIGYIQSGATCVSRGSCPAAGTHSSMFGYPVKVISGSWPSTVCLNGCAAQSGNGVVTSNGLMWNVYVGANTGATCSVATGSLVTSAPAVQNVDTASPVCDTPDILIVNKFGYICATPASVASGAAANQDVGAATGASGILAAGSISQAPSSTTITGSVTVSNLPAPLDISTLATHTDISNNAASIDAAIDIAASLVVANASSNKDAIVSAVNATKFPYTDVDSVLGAAPAAESISSATPTFDATTPLTFSSASGCPSDVAIPISASFLTHTYYISFTPMCDLATTLRPIFIALTAIAATIIFAAGLTI